MNMPSVMSSNIHSTTDRKRVRPMESPSVSRFISCYLDWYTPMLQRKIHAYLPCDAVSAACTNYIPSYRSLPAQSPVAYLFPLDSLPGILRASLFPPTWYLVTDSVFSIRCLERNTWCSCQRLYTPRLENKM